MPSRVFLGKLQGDLAGYPFVSLNYAVSSSESFQQAGFPEASVGGFNGTVSWWTSTGLTTSLDLLDAAVHQNGMECATVGQLKRFATYGKTYLDSLSSTVFPGGAGTAITNLVNGFNSVDNNAIAKVGQVKHVSKVFLDRIAQVDLGRTGHRRYLEYSSGSTYVPLWTTTPTDDDDHAVATIGQMKRAFAFDFNSDNDGDGLPRWWELKYLRATPTDVDPDNHASGCLRPQGDYDCDGISNLNEWNNGTNPGYPDTVIVDTDNILVIYNANLTENGDLKSRVAQLLGKEEPEISTGQMSYDLRRLKGHGVIRKIEGTHRYEVTEEGLRLALFISQVERRVYQEGASELFSEWHEGNLHQAYNAFGQEVESLFARHHLSRAA